MTCPTCHTKVVRDPAAPSKLLPFCSERCRWVDLGRWFGEEYRIASAPAEPSEAARRDED